MATRIPLGLFGTASRTSTLLVIGMLGETHASEVAKVIGKSLSRVQAAIESFEIAGIVVAAEEGKTRRVRLNPRYPALPELQALLDKLGSLDVPLQKQLAEKRRRPRRSGKAL